MLLVLFGQCSQLDEGLTLELAITTTILATSCFTNLARSTTHEKALPVNCICISELESSSA